MSRIDDALKRLAGVVSPEPRVPSMLERYASEGKLRVDDGIITKPVPVEDHRLVRVPPAGPRPVEGRPAAKSMVAPAPVAHPDPAVEIEADVESEPLVNVRQVFDYLGFVARSVRRHKLLAFGTAALVLALAAAAAVLLPKSYHLETKLLAQRNAVMAALSNPGRAIPWDADAPTRAAAETVLRRDNLIALVRQTDLIREWERTRAPILRLKDWLIATATRHTPTPDEKLDAIVGLLEVRMVVVAGPVGDGTVTIDLDWPDGAVGYRLVQAAQQSFLDARQVAETAAIGESIAILERYSASLHQDVNRTLEELQRTQGTGASAAPVSRIAQARRTPTSVVPTLAASLHVPQLQESLDGDPELNRMKKTLDSKRQDLARIEETRQRQLTDLQARLAELKGVYTSNHPSVLSVQQNLAALAQDPPQALALAAEIEELQADYDKQLGDATDLQIHAEVTRKSAVAAAAALGAPAAPAAPQLLETVAPPALLGRSADVQMGQFGTLRLRSELNQLENVLERTDGARIELAVSQAAFKYRYTVIRPAQIPRSPKFPDVRLIIAAGAFASLFLALAVVVCKDLLSNRIFEPWQIERQLGLRVLGTLRTA
jgi:uncharacterized protein involved in exopolysaccharide biosynthesis